MNEYFNQLFIYRYIVSDSGITVLVLVKLATWVVLLHL